MSDWNNLDIQEFIGSNNKCAKKYFLKKDNDEAFNNKICVLKQQSFYVSFKDILKVYLTHSLNYF